MGLFPYIGGDTKYATFIVSLLPRGSKFLEPFGGAGSVSLRVAHSNLYESMVWNDLDPLIYDAFRLIKHYPESIPLIQKALAKLSRCMDSEARGKAKEYLKEIRSKLASGSMSWPLTGIWTVVLHYVCHVPYKSGIMLRWTDNPRRYLNVGKHLRGKHHLLKRITIRNEDGIDLLLDNSEPNAVAYVDPPHLTESSRSTGYYRIDFTEEKAMELDEVLRSLKMKILVKLSPSDLPYYKLAEEWEKIPLTYTKDSKPTIPKRSQGTYIFCMNYKPSLWP